MQSAMSTKNRRSRLPTFTCLHASECFGYNLEKEKFTQKCKKEKWGEATPKHPSSVRYREVNFRSAVCSNDNYAQLEARESEGSDGVYRFLSAALRLYEAIKATATTVDSTLPLSLLRSPCFFFFFLSPVPTLVGQKVHKNWWGGRRRLIKCKSKF